MTSTEQNYRHPDAPTYDPFAVVGYPSLSFKTVPVGGFYETEVTGLPEWVQCIDDDGRPAHWLNDDGTRGRAKMAAVTEVRVIRWGHVDADGHDVIDGNAFDDTDPDDWQRSVWAVKPSAIYGAIRKAVKDSHTLAMEIGGSLRVDFVGEGPKPTSKTQSPQKLYSAVYRAPNAATDAPF